MRFDVKRLSLLATAVVVVIGGGVFIATQTIAPGADNLQPSQADAKHSVQTAETTSRAGEGVTASTPALDTNKQPAPVPIIVMPAATTASSASSALPAVTGTALVEDAFKTMTVAQNSMVIAGGDKETPARPDPGTRLGASNALATPFRNTMGCPIMLRTLNTP